MSRILIIITLIILLSGCLRENTLDVCSLLSDDFRSECVLRIAVKQDDPSVCDKHPAGCGGVYIEELKNLELCVKLGDKSCVERVAINLRDPSVCERLGEVFVDGLLADVSKYDCYENVAIALVDSSICDRIPVEWGSENCKMLTERNTSVCELEEYPTEEYVLVCRGWVSGNLSYCNLILDDKLKESCYWNTGKRMKNPDECLSIRDWTFELACLRGAIEHHTFSGEVCELFDGGYDWFARSVCFYRAAKESLDAGLCRNIDSKFYDGFGQDVCVLEVAVLGNNRKLCDNITDGNYSRMCQAVVAA